MSGLRDNLIFAFFGACFVVCAMLWFQLSRIPDYSEFQRPNIMADQNESVRVERVLALADRMIATTSIDQGDLDAAHNLSQNPFELLGRPKNVSQVQRPELPALRLTGISWNTQLPLAVLNENILGEGELLPESEIRVKQIEPEQVLVSYKGYTYNVDLPAHAKGGN